jgi:hypothetical protein
MRPTYQKKIKTQYDNDMAKLRPLQQGDAQEDLIMVANTTDETCRLLEENTRLKKENERLQMENDAIASTQGPQNTINWLRGLVIMLSQASDAINKSYFAATNFLQELGGDHPDENVMPVKSMIECLCNFMEMPDGMSEEDMRREIDDLLKAKKQNASLTKLVSSAQKANEGIKS